MLQGMITMPPGQERAAGDPGGEILVVMIDQAARAKGRRRPWDRIGSRPINRADLLAEHLRRRSGLIVKWTVRPRRQSTWSSRIA